MTFVAGSTFSEHKMKIPIPLLTHITLPFHAVNDNIEIAERVPFQVQHNSIIGVAPARKQSQEEFGEEFASCNIRLPHSQSLIVFR